MFDCRICGNSAENTAITARETMFDTWESFEYFGCAACGCLQIIDIPGDMSKYYPSGYYSRERYVKDNPLIIYLKRKRLRQWLAHNSTIGRLLAYKGKPPAFVEWVKQVNVCFNDAILDVGSGSGDLLHRMEIAGFTKLTGVDPFVEQDLTYKNGVRILKRSLSEVVGTYDFIMLNHSFEHMPSPLKTLEEVRRLLKADGSVLIRIPLAQSFAWETYGTDWVQFDAPRHFYLHTEKSLDILAKQAGFVIEHVTFDSTAFQFWGSIQCQHGVALRSDRSYAVSPANSMFSEGEIRSFNIRAAKLNDERKGDQACFYLRIAS